MRVALESWAIYSFSLIPVMAQILRHAHQGTFILSFLFPGISLHFLVHSMADPREKDKEIISSLSFILYESTNPWQSVSNGSMDWEVDSKNEGTAVALARLAGHHKKRIRN
jgi:hypothetical protein